ncbi:MAG: rhombosortase [Sulfuricurvum sp.]|nr:rhombosortase [Sulfuricurvum sp.]
MVKEFFMYDRCAIENAEVWRLVSAHLVHLTPMHLGVNVIGFTVVYLISRKYVSGGEFITKSVIFAIAISLSLYLFSPEVTYYGGMSGVLYALAAWLAIIVSEKKRAMGIAVAIIFAVKIGYEHFSGSIVVYDGFRVITDAHLYGYGWGLFFGLIRPLFRRKDGTAARLIG